MRRYRNIRFANEDVQKLDKDVRALYALLSRNYSITNEINRRFSNLMSSNRNSRNLASAFRSFSYAKEELGEALRHIDDSFSELGSFIREG